MREPWRLTKLVALLAYGDLGTVAPKRGRSRAMRGGSFAAALVVYGYIIAVAMTRSPTPGLFAELMW